MYSTCLFCGSALGKNESIEHVPVGRRLAFDGEKGRLWVICPACARWNLSPLEERWEAIEACERAFRATPLHTSTENIGLARLRDGTELVRIGRPLRPEFAAWRYGAVMAGRARRATWHTGMVATGVLTAIGVMAAGPLALAAGAPVFARMMLGLAGTPASPPYDAKKALRALRTNAGDLLVPRDHMLQAARIQPGRALPGGWGLQVQTIDLVRGYQAQNQGIISAYAVRHLLTGAPAIRATGVLMAYANTAGGSPRQVDDAVKLIQRVESPERWFARAEHEARRAGWGYQSVWHMPPAIRLALEMASHEGSERRALEGELSELEAAWRDAEELAAISDALLVPPAVEQTLASMRAGRGPSPVPSSSAPVQPPAALPDVSSTAATPARSGLAAARAQYARRMAERRSHGET